MRLSAPASSAIAPIVRSPGSKLITHWRRKYSRGVSEQLRPRPAVRVEELVEAVHPVRDPAAAALEHRDLAASGWRSSTPAYTRFESVMYWSTNRMTAWCVPVAIRSIMRFDVPSMSKRPAPCRPSGMPVLLERVVHRVEVRATRAAGRAPGSGGSRRRAGPCRERAAPRRRRPPGSCAGITALPTSRSGAADAQSAIQSFHTWWHATASSRILDAAERLAEPAVEHRDVDALGVEHAHALLRVEAGRVAVLVAHRVARSSRSCACPRCRARRAPSGCRRRPRRAPAGCSMSSFQRTRGPRSRIDGGRFRSQRSTGSQTWPSASTTTMWSELVPIGPPDHSSLAASAGYLRSRRSLLASVLLACSRRRRSVVDVPPSRFGR